MGSVNDPFPKDNAVLRNYPSPGIGFASMTVETGCPGPVTAAMVWGIHFYVAATDLTYPISAPMNQSISAAEGTIRSRPVTGFRTRLPEFLGGGGRRL